MRHANTDRTQMDTDGDTFDDCDNQRNLSAEGREQAKRIGLIIQKLRIPIGTVLSSPYCRTKETAKLAFGQFGVVSKLQYSFTKNSEEFKRLGADLLTMMKKTEAEEKNDVFVGHSANLKDGLGVWPKPEGVLVVFKKSGEDIIFKGMIQPDEWPK
ncbi:histidine phosphatase family protein [uncultured Cocleimonas sp.]|uniref:histidine phosphatase family protein n=1 Tax=uncultured Cocleimonas sp. TaxID=1051587 RepID=UPI0026078C1C|nr:histidine phosphatase family protein [uncultured Cocleimonas sp.]